MYNRLILIVITCLFFIVIDHHSYALENPILEKSIELSTNGTYSRSFSQLTFLEIDHDDNIYLIDQGYVHIISLDGIFKSYWNHLDTSWDLEIDSKNNVYLSTDREPYRILKVSTSGEILQTWGTQNSDVLIDFPGKYGFNIFVDNFDNLYISEITKDENNKREFLTITKKYSETGDLIQTLNNLPVPIIQDSKGFFYGRSNENIIKFDSSGNILLEFGGYVVDLAIDKDDIIYATRGNQSPVMFDINGNPFLTFGSFGIGGDKFNQPRGIGVDSNGQIFVADYGKTNLLIFSSYVRSSESENSVDLSFDEKEARLKYDDQIYANMKHAQEYGSPLMEPKDRGMDECEDVSSYCMMKWGFGDNVFNECVSNTIDYCKSKEQFKQSSLESASISEPIPTELELTCGAGTELVNGICQVIKTEEKSNGGGCLIATATYGSELAPQVQKLREIRDNKLLQTESGTNFMNMFNNFYYSFSPTIADWERESPVFKELVKVTITPMISSLSILNYVDMDSEVSVLGYGVSLIILNFGMYVGIPILSLMRFRK